MVNHGLNQLTDTFFCFHLLNRLFWKNKKSQIRSREKGRFFSEQLPKHSLANLCDDNKILRR